MTAKEIADIAQALEKLGYEVIKIKEMEGDVVFSDTVKIKLIPLKSKSRTSKK